MYVRMVKVKHRQICIYFFTVCFLLDPPEHFFSPELKHLMYKYPEASQRGGGAAGAVALLLWKKRGNCPYWKRPHLNFKIVCFFPSWKKLKRGSFVFVFFLREISLLEKFFLHFTKNLLVSVHTSWHYRF